MATAHVDEEAPMTDTPQALIERLRPLAERLADGRQAKISPKLPDDLFVHEDGLTARGQTFSLKRTGADIVAVLDALSAALRVTEPIDVQISACPDDIADDVLAHATVGDFRNIAHWRQTGK